MSPRNSRRSIASGVTLLLLAALAAGLWWFRTDIRDWYVASTFTPSAEVAAIPAASGMNDTGTRLFYASQPEIDEASSFNAKCERREATGALLGCYANGQIYLYDITNQELQGIVEVTAAHEMLHAAWERLPTYEQERLTPLLEAEYQRHKTAELEQRMQYYDRQQPGERANELHSILATEVADIADTALREHYDRYFADRMAVVKLHQAYSSVFERLNQQAKALEARIASESAAINTAIASFNARMQRLNQSAEAHIAARGSVDRANAAAVSAYNARLAELRQEEQALAGERAALDARIAAYTADVAEYNKLSTRTTELNASIDSMSAQSTQL